MLDADEETNVLLLTVDCFRHDQLEEADWLVPVPGGHIRFENCIASGPGTPMAFLGLLSSTYPLEAGGYNAVGDGRTLLPEQLREAGYATGAFHSNPLLGERYGYDAGFDTFYDSIDGKRRVNDALKSLFPQPLVDLVKGAYLSVSRDELPYLRAEDINDWVLDWVDGRDRPYFCWAHYMDMHHPYLPPTEYRGVDEAEARRLWRTLNDAEADITDEEVERLRTLYEQERAYLADTMRSLLETLGRRGELENTIVVLTGDHGEEFREHGSMTHKAKLYEELVRVPLVFAGDVVAGNHVREGVVSGIDVPATVLNAVGGERVVTPSSYRGMSLFADGYDRKGAYAEIAHDQVGEISADDMVVTYRTDRWKYILDFQRDKTELYDLEHDPGEQNNLVESNPERAEGLRTRIDDHIENHLTEQYQPEVAVSDTVEDRLADLGYK